MTAKKDPRKELAAVQAKAEGASSAEKLEFMGEQFRLAEKVGVLPLLKYSAYADEPNLVGPAAAALYQVLKDTIHPDDWARWEQVAMDRKAGADDLFAVLSKAIEILTARPTTPPSGSSATS